MNSRHLSTALYATGAAIALLMHATPAWADRYPPGVVNCYDSDAADTALNPSYVNCSATYEAALPAPQTTLVKPFAGYGDFDFVGQTTNDGSGSGPFQPFGKGFKFGTLVLDVPESSPFIVALSSFGDYSMYLYDPSAVPGMQVFKIEFSTNGTTNEIGGPFQLDYANLYALAPIPEPATGALTLAGLAGIAFIQRRRHRKT